MDCTRKTRDGVKPFVLAILLYQFVEARGHVVVPIFGREHP